MASVVKPARSVPTGIRRYFPRTRRAWLIVIAVVILSPLVFAYVLARMTPAWYQPLDPNSVDVFDAGDMGQHKIEDLHNLAERVPLGDQLWSISQTEINSALAIRFAPPMNADGRRYYPAGSVYPSFSSPFVLLTPGRVTFAARSTKLPGWGPGGVASITFSVATFPGVGKDAPTALVQIEGAWVGELRIPQFLVEAKLRAYIPELIAAVTRADALAIRDSSKIQPEIDSVIHAIEDGKPFLLKGTYDRRVVIIKELHVNDGTLTVVFGPETPAAVRPRPLSGQVSQPPLVMPNP